MADDKKGARSYKGEVIGDSMAITINFTWLLQIIADLNKQIDLPFASENQEKIMLEGVWEIIEDAVKKALPKK